MIGWSLVNSLTTKRLPLRVLALAVESPPRRTTVAMDSRGMLQPPSKLPERRRRASGALDTPSFGEPSTRTLKIGTILMLS